MAKQEPVIHKIVQQSNRTARKVFGVLLGIYLILLLLLHLIFGTHYDDKWTYINPIIVIGIIFIAALCFFGLLKGTRDRQ